MRIRVRESVRRAALALCVIAAATTVPTAAWIAWPLPASALARDGGEGITIVDRNGVTLRSTRASDGSNARWIPYERIDPDLINAFVAVEDRRFWDHHGVDVRAVGRALRDNVRARHVVSGASTITMQLARLLSKSDNTHTAIGKLAQTVLAFRLEAHLSKRQILEQYLNRVELGQGTVGVAAASDVYFETSASEVSVGQAAMLAGLAHAPSRDNPQVSIKRARARRTIALSRMMRMGFATREDIARAKAEPLVNGAGRAPFRAPHFTTQVLEWTADDRDAHRSSTIRTSLDVALQSEIEAEVRETVASLHDRGVGQAAVVVLDNSTGEVLAWVGSPDFWASENGQTDMVSSPRQPGSALKPFVYGLAFDRGFTAATVIPDIPKSYATTIGAYRPRDYDRRFRGPVRAREALASSYNVPAVELASRLGVTSVLSVLHLAGFQSLDRDADFYGLGLALGNGDVTLIELANAYRALANGGEWRPWTWRPIPPNSKLSNDSHRVISPVSSAIVLDILADPAARMPGFGFETPFDFPFPVAVKTGTSRHFTDNWAVGTTRGFTVAVWAGNFDGKPMEGVSGVTGAGPLLHRAVMMTSRHVAPGALTTPSEAGALPESVCRLSGLRATDGCAHLTEWFASGTQPTRDDDWERGGSIVLPSEYADWSASGLAPAAVDKMAVAQSLETSNRGLKRPADSAATFRILSPLDGDRYSVPPGVEGKYASIPLRAMGPSGSAPVMWTVDGKPYDAERWQLAAGAHVISAKSSRGDSSAVRIFVDAATSASAPR